VSAETQGLRTSYGGFCVQEPRHRSINIRPKICFNMNHTVITTSHSRKKHIKDQGSYDILYAIFMNNVQNLTIWERRD